MKCLLFLKVNDLGRKNFCHRVEISGANLPASQFESAALPMERRIYGGLTPEVSEPGEDAARAATGRSALGEWSPDLCESLAPQEGIREEGRNKRTHCDHNFFKHDVEINSFKD